jgi:hypothetical protein
MHETMHATRGLFDNLAAIEHAARWATSHYGPEHGSTFVEFLQSLDDDEQARIADRGYTVCTADYEDWLDSQSCAECGRSYGPHYTGPCTHY